jgi:hypothetical protein
MKLVHREGFEPSLFWFVAKDPFQLNDRCIVKIGVPGEIRTPNQLVRSQPFCPLNYRHIEMERWIGFEPMIKALQAIAFPDLATSA